MTSGVSTLAHAGVRLPVAQGLRPSSGSWSSLSGTVLRSIVALPWSEQPDPQPQYLCCIPEFGGSRMGTPSSTSETIVLVHGMWMTPLSWEHWVSRFESQGHRVLAPAWPGLDAEPEKLRRDPSPLAVH